METALAAIKEFEVMRMFRKRQFNGWLFGHRSEVSFLNELFGVYT